MELGHFSPVWSDRQVALELGGGGFRQAGRVKVMPRTDFPSSCFLSVLEDDAYCVRQWSYLQTNSH